MKINSVVTRLSKQNVTVRWLKTRYYMIIQINYLKNLMKINSLVTGLSNRII